MSTRLYYDRWGNYAGGSTSNPMLAGLLRNPLTAQLAPQIESINYKIDHDPDIQRLVAYWQRFVMWIVALALTVLWYVVFSLISCAPMWQRICVHPNLIRLHVRRAKNALIGGGLLLLPKVILMVTGFRLPLTECSYYISLNLIPLAGATMILGLGQKALSNRFHYWSHGAGFGLFNLINLLRNHPPTQVWTYVQDTFLIGLICWGFFCPGPFFWGSVGSILWLLILLPYTWFCQWKYSNGSAISFC